MLKNEKNITDTIFVGLATDYCVYNTFLDAVKHGNKVHLILNCIQGVVSYTTDKTILDII
jgi:nicotinamidase-related amidase